MTSRLIRTLATALLLPLAAAAQEEQLELDEITITSDLREDTLLQEAPTSVTVLDRETIDAAGEQHFREVLHLIPNLNFSSATNRPRFFQLRGIGERSQYEGAPNPSVGFLVDDIDFSGIGTVATLFDVDRVEVLRGPQGTRYGANALAGLVYVRTAEPSRTPARRLESILGDDGTWGAGFAATGPVGESSAYRFALHQYRSDGFRRNDFFNSDDTNDRDEFMVRGKWRWRPSERLQLDTTLLSVDIDNGFDTFAPENTLVVHSDDPGRDAQESTGFSTRISFSHDALDLISITTAASSDILYSFDGDWGNPDYWGEFSPYDFTSETDRERRTISQEFRLASRPGAELFSGSTEWLVGVYVQDLDETNHFEDYFNDALFRLLDSDFEATSVAAFGQLDTALSEDLTLTSGLRVERREADYRDTSGLDLEPSDTMVGGQLSLTRALDDRRSTYLTLARGYKAGGFNLGLSIPEARREFDPEYLWNLEAGLKGSFAQGRLWANLALFYSEREDMQVGTSFQADPEDPLTFVFFTDNAASGTNLGLEAEWRYQLTGSWELFGSLGLLDTEFDDFVTAERDLSGREQAHAPSYQTTVGAEYRSPGGWFARADVFAQDGFYFSDSHDRQADSHQRVNLKLGYEADSWSVYAWARNLTDERYPTRGFFFGLEPPAFPTREYVQLGDPRHIGVTARFSF